MGAQLQGRIKSSHGRNKAHRAMAEINVTPFVDVMLVLLVVFMITAPLLTAGVKIELPETKAKPLSKQDNKPVEITIDKNGNLYFGKTKITEKELLNNLRHIAGKSMQQQVYIRADKGVSYGRAMHVMVLVNKAGLSKIALITKNE